MPQRSVTSRIVHESAHEPLLNNTQPWWEGLDERFFRNDETFDLGFFDRARIGVTAVGDVLLRTAGASLLGTLSLPLGYGPKQIRDIQKDGAFYAALADQGDKSAVFIPPAKNLAVYHRKPWKPTFRPDDGSVDDLTFASPFIPLNPAVRASYLSHKANRTAHARYWRHKDGPRPTIIAIHGFSADLALVNQWFFAIPWLYKIGCDVLLFTLPFHGPRQTRFSPFSGHGFFAGGIPRINEAFIHAIHDLRVFMDYLEGRGVSDIGVTGVSLGGFTSSLLASVDSRLRFAIPNVPVVSIGDLVLEWEPIGSVVKAAMKATGVSLPDIRHMLAPTCPLTWAPELTRDQLMIIAGVGDRLAPPKHSRILWEHWDHCRVHWFPGSHLLHLDKGAYFKQMAMFMAGLGFIPAQLSRTNS